MKVKCPYCRTQYDLTRLNVPLSRDNWRSLVTILCDSTECSFYQDSFDVRINRRPWAFKLPWTRRHLGFNYSVHKRPEGSRPTTVFR